MRLNPPEKMRPLLSVAAVEVVPLLHFKTKVADAVAFLLSDAASYDVMTLRGWHTTGVYGSLGAAAGS